MTESKQWCIGFLDTQEEAGRRDRTANEWDEAGSLACGLGQGSTQPPPSSLLPLPHPSGQFPVADYADELPQLTALPSHAAVIEYVRM